MWVGIGVGIGRNRFATGIFNAYALRVTADGGITEAGQCVDAVSGLLLSASLLLIPSGYKGGKLYAEIPTNGNGDLTWTRGSDGFRTNASGLIQRVPWNLLQRSEEFENAVWTKTRSTISSNVTNAPNGTLTADKLVETATTGSHNVLQSSLPSNTGFYTYSCYAKKSERNWILFVVYTGLADCLVWFDIDNGTIGTITNASGSASTTATIENVGDGWYRCSATINKTSTNTGIVGCFTSTGNNTISYTGDGTSGIFIWGAQLVEGTTAQTYLPTTDRLNFPRLSYMYGSCPAVLLEPQRTNLCLWSNTFNDASWGKSTAGVGIAPIVTANAGTSPDGTNNASRVQFNCVGTTSADRSFMRQTINIINATNYAATIYVKAYSSGEIGKQLRFIWEGAVNQIIITLTDSWQRVSATGVSNATSSNFLIETRGTFTTNTTADVLIYGAQAEAGAYPTTYISTTSATATRVADSFSRSNIYTNGLITASGGTWFVELRGNVALTRDAFADGLQLTNTAVTDRFTFTFGAGSPATSLVTIRKAVGGTLTSLYLTTTSTTKIAIKWNGTTADIFANGTKVVSATSFTATQLENLTGSGADTPKFIQQMALYPSPLTDTQCQTLTTL